MFDRINNVLVRAYLFAREERGQTVTEYALVLGLIAALAIGVLTATGTGVTAKLRTVCQSITGAAPGGACG
jgi:Flp pilus assembly pilin Flp